MALVAARRDIEVLVVEQDPHLGLLGRRRTFTRQLLDETAGAPDSPVDILIEPPVDAQGFGYPERLERGVPFVVAAHDLRRIWTDAPPISDLISLGRPSPGVLWQPHERQGP